MTLAVLLIDLGEAMEIKMTPSILNIDLKHTDLTLALRHSKFLLNTHLGSDWWMPPAGNIPVQPVLTCAVLQGRNSS